jgi:hypothetical protein
MTATGEDPVQITPNGEPRDVPVESPDAKFIYYHKGWPLRSSVWRMPVDGGEETRVIESVHIYGQWSVCDRGIFFLKPDDERGRSEMCLYDFDTGRISKIMTIDGSVYFYIAASRDGRSLLYAQFEGGSDLMLVENFR